MTELEELLAAVTPPDEEARKRAHRRWANCAKPLGSLGLLETALEDIAALIGSEEIDLSRRAVLVLCADNGVVAQGVTQTDSSVTAIVTRNLALRQTSVCQMAAVAGWVTDNGYEFDGPAFNIYHVSPHETNDPEQFVTEVCYPVRKA